MNMSKLVSYILTEESLTNLMLPFKNNSTQKAVPADQVVQTVIKTMTVPIYSDIVPWKRTGTIDIKDMKCIDKENAIYLLPAELTQTPIKYISDIHLPFQNHRGTFGDVAPAYGINRSVQGVATSMAYMMVAGQMRSEPTWDDLGANKVRLFGWPKTKIEITVACEHLPNIESVEESCWSSFSELATLDVEVFLYNNFRFHKTIPTAHGNYDLPIDKWEGAAQERKEWIKDAKEVAHLDEIDWVSWM